MNFAPNQTRLTVEALLMTIGTRDNPRIAIEQRHPLIALDFDIFQKTF